MMEKEEIQNLEKVRDDKCFPLVKNIVKELPYGLIVPDEKQKELQLKCLSGMLAKDLNISQEVSYIFQTLLSVFSGVNTTIQGLELTNDDEKYDVLSRKVLQIIADEIDTIGLDAKPEDMIKDFSGVKDKLLKLFSDESLSRMEVKYIMDNIFEKFTTLHNAVTTSLEKSTEKMECKILGIDTMGDLTLKKLNDVLINDLEQSKK